MKFPIAAALALAAAAACVFAADSADSLKQGFTTPPADTRPMLRWWWFGPAVVKPQLEREMTLMKEGGFGGFEVQPTYPLALDGQYPGLKNTKFLSPEFFDLLGFTAAKSREIGLRMDLTLGSGWPYGGPMFSRTEAVQSIADGGPVKIEPGAKTVTAPAPARHGGGPDAPLFAALLGPVTDAAYGASPWIPLAVKGRVAELPADLHGATQVRFFVYAPAALMQVKRAAYGAEGFIVDHYNRAAIETFISAIAQPEIAACGPNPPYSVFCDSLEVVGEGWTPNFPAEFRRRRGYDLIPLLPALFDQDFPHAAEIRGDYGLTIAELFDDVFVDRFTKLAHDDHTRFRLQAYGTPPTTLTTYGRVDIDEGENFNWRALSGTRWASSASHLLGRPVTSSEAFTWLHSPVFMAAPIDIKAESNLQFLNGVNQLLFHGWPYTAPGVEYPGWRFYAAAVFNEKNPWWIVMPDITGYLARTSYLLRQGNPANDVAVYLPEEDAFSEMTPSSLQMVGAGGNGILNRLVNPVVPQILDAGFNFDGIDAGILAARGKVEHGALVFGDVRYRLVVLPRMSHISTASLRTLEEFANQGGTLIAVDEAPSLAPGYLTTDAERAAVKEISARLFGGTSAKGVVVPLAQLGSRLAQVLSPDVAFDSARQTLGFVHRRVGDADVYFVANTSNQPVKTSAKFRTSAAAAEWWDANTGSITDAPVEQSGSAATTVIDLPPYGAGFLVFGCGKESTRALAARSSIASTIDLTQDWDVSYRNAAPEPNPAPELLKTLGSWTEQPATRFFSGVAAYVRSVDVPAAMLSNDSTVQLDFGTGTPGAVAGGPMGMRADLQPPIGDAAVVYVNGRRAGALWCPPYQLDVTALLHSGRNELKIEVANRAVNLMADTEHHPLPDYHALNANRELGGNRFQPQDLAHISAMPSGLLGTVRLLVLR